MDTADTNWVTGEACLWFDNDEHTYHEARRIVKQSMENKSAGSYGDRLALERLLRDAVPHNDFSVISQIADIDWDVVIDHLITDIKEGYE
mgnify:CR=1 FL=1